MKGKIIKGIAGFYYVDTGDGSLYECRARGIFRKDGIRPLVGDEVEIDVLDAAERTGNVAKILPRRNVLIRPAAANVDQALVIFAMTHPSPNFLLLDRFLVMMEQAGIPATICFNKKDTAKEEEMDFLLRTYTGCGYPVLFTSARENEGIRELKELLRGKTTVVAGPSGVGKSSLTNCVQPDIRMETGEISRKLGRGKHTTRHAQLVAVDRDTYLMDTPGFSSLYLENMEKEELRMYFREFVPYEGKCRFQGCAHIHEPECAVKEALEAGRISRLRYENYLELYRELQEKRRY